MSVTIKNVRDCLNNISTSEVTDDTIGDKILDAEAWVEDAGGDPDDGANGERAVKYYAAWLSYIVSNTYLQASTGPISIREPYEQRAAHLLKMAQKALARSLDKPQVLTKKIRLLRKRTSTEQEQDPNILRVSK